MVQWGVSDMSSSDSKNRLLFILFFIIFIVVINVPVPGIGGITASGQEYLIWVVIFTILFLSFVRVIRDKVLITPSCLKYFLLYAVLILSSSIFSPIMNMDIFTINAMHLMAGVLIWLSLHQYRLKEGEKEGVLLIILISAVIGAVIFLFEPYLFAGYVSPVGGVFGQKNLFASWAATGMVISLYLITTDRFEKFTNIKKVLLYMAVLLLSAGLILASSRAGLLGAGLAMLVLLISGKHRYIEVKKSLTVWVLVLVVGMAAGFYLSTAKSGLEEEGLMESVKTEARHKAEWLSDTKQRSYAERLLMYRTSYEMFKQRPLSGQGFSNFGSLYMYYQAETAGKEDRRLILDYTTHPHNEFFYILAECGLLGMAAIAIALFGVVRVLYGMGAKRAGIYIALMIPLFVHMMIGFPLKLSTGHYLVFLILLYMVTDRDVEEKEVRLQKGMSVAVIVMAAMLYAGSTAYAFKTFEDYMNFVAFRMKFADEKGVISEEHIRPAMDNIYLRNWAVPAYMYKKALEAVSSPEIQRDFIERFLIWNKGEKMKRPVMKSFYIEGLVLYYLASHDIEKGALYLEQAIKTTEEGLYIYPNDSYLRPLKQKVISASGV
jgi:O-antigen polymerase